MITINAGATNSITLRFSDNIVGDNPLYLFEFKSIQSGNIFRFIPQDQSTTKRYNKFQVIEITGLTGSSISLTSSIPSIELDYGGFFNYKVYETYDYSLTPTDIILDYGKMLFINQEYQSFFF